MAPNLKARFDQLRTRLSPRHSKVISRHERNPKCTLSFERPSSPPSQDSTELSPIKQSTPAPNFFKRLPREIRDIVHDGLLDSMVAHIVTGRKHWGRAPETIRYCGSDSTSGLFNELLGSSGSHTPITKIFNERHPHLDRQAQTLRARSPREPPVLPRTPRACALALHHQRHAALQFLPLALHLPFHRGEDPHAQPLHLLRQQRPRLKYTRPPPRPRVLAANPICRPDESDLRGRSDMDGVSNLEFGLGMRQVRRSGGGFKTWPVLKAADVVTFEKAVGKEKAITFQYNQGLPLRLTLGNGARERPTDDGRVPFCIREERRGFGVLLGKGKRGKK